MRKLYRTIKAFWLPLVLFVAEVALVFPVFEKFIFDYLDEKCQIYIATMLLIVFMVNQFFTVQTPLRKLREFENDRLDIVSSVITPVLKEYKQTYGCDLRANIMLLKRRFVAYLNPRRNDKTKRRLDFFLKTLRIVWHSESMRYSKDRDLEFTTKQGGCGKAADDGKPILLNLTEEGAEDYNLNQEQLEKTKDLKFVISWPIIKQHTHNGKLVDTVIGVVNIDSKSEGAEHLIDGETLDEMQEHARLFSDLCSHLF